VCSILFAKSGQRFKNIVAHWFLSCATSPRAAITKIRVEIWQNNSKILVEIQNFFPEEKGIL
jgi:hypothetical protein